MNQTQIKKKIMRNSNAPKCTYGERCIPPVKKTTTIIQCGKYTQKTTLTTQKRKKQLPRYINNGIQINKITVPVVAINLLS